MLKRARAVEDVSVLESQKWSFGFKKISFKISLYSLHFFIRN